MKKDINKEQKDMEKEKKHIKQEKKKAKKKGKFMRTVLLLAIALLLIGFIIGKFGFGFGGGAGDSNNASVDSTENVSQVATSSKNVVSVSVIENDYFYDNKKLGLDELVTRLNLLEGICVEITSDNATLKAYNSLTDELKEHGIEYVDKN